MDVSSMARVSKGFAQYEVQAQNTKNSKSTAQNSKTQTQTESDKVGDAFKLDISTAAKQAQQTDEDTNEIKGLTDEQSDALEQDYLAAQQNLFNVMIKVLTDTNDQLKGWLDDGVGFLNFDGTKIETALFGMPEVATNAEDAKKAISEGGEWSVDAVATRICDLAFAIAGDDPEKLSQMRSAIEKGFEQAGMTWKDATGQDSMPSITNDTNAEIMRRLDKRAEELNGAQGNSGASLTD